MYFEVEIVADVLVYYLTPLPHPFKMNSQEFSDIDPEIPNYSDY